MPDSGTRAFYKYSMYSILKTNTACTHVLFTNKACWIHFTNTACWIYTASGNIRIYSMLNCHINIIQHVETSSHTACWLAHYLTSMLNAYVSPVHVPIITPIVDQLYDIVPTLGNILDCPSSLRVVSPGNRHWHTTPERTPWRRQRVLSLQDSLPEP